MSALNNFIILMGCGYCMLDGDIEEVFSNE